MSTAEATHREQLLHDLLLQAGTIDPVPSREILTTRIRGHAERLQLGDVNYRLALMAIAALCLAGVDDYDQQRAVEITQRFTGHRAAAPANQR